MNYIENIWYAAAWDTELASSPIGRTIIGKAIVLYRAADGAVIAMEDRCPHRHAPLSLGRVEGDELRCMYHGLKFGRDGKCRSVPGADAPPPNVGVRTFPVVERSSWIWVWMGDPAKANPDQIPHGFGLANPDWMMKAGALDYAADYQLINDNLCDLSHLDFVHETTLRAATGAPWSAEQPKVTTLDNGLKIERWFIDHPLMPGQPQRCDTFNTYYYWLPGIFIMATAAYPVGTAAAAAANGGVPTAEPLFERVEQQAVTPIAERRTRYLFASGVGARYASPELLEGMYAVVQAAFAEDKRMIEAQQAIWDQTSPNQPKAFIPQDKAPAIMRRLISRRLSMERPTPASEIAT